MRVVADTNVLISAFLFGGLPNHFLEFGLSGAFALVTSSPLMEELEEKLRGKFSVPGAKAQAFLVQLSKSAIVIQPSITLNAVPDDESDNRVLESAIAGHADFIVSGDKHLLRLGSYEGIPILKVRQFLQAANLLSD